MCSSLQTAHSFLYLICITYRLHSYRVEHLLSFNPEQVLGITTMIEIYYRSLSLVKGYGKILSFPKTLVSYTLFAFSAQGENCFAFGWCCKHLLIFDQVDELLASFWAADH